jgi:carbohydrate diacid regulator
MLKMISNQIIQTSIEELKSITKTDLFVMDLQGNMVASTIEDTIIDKAVIINFADSPADSQVIGGLHLLKIQDETEAAYILAAKGNSNDTYMIGKIAVSQIQHLIVAYKERYDRNNFFQNLILDNMLLVDIYNKAKKLHIEVEIPRVVFLIETKVDKDNEIMEMLKSLFSNQAGDYLTSVDERNIILIKSLKEVKHAEKYEYYAHVEEIAKTIVDMMCSEAMMNVKVSYGTIVKELKEVSKSYKEAKMALEVGKIFYAERSIMAYNTLGIGRLIYQLPVNLCKIFMEEVFGYEMPVELDEESLITIHKFFENNLNVSETSRQLFIHRNTLVYRIEKLQKATGLDIRTFDDALVFKIALMVANYMKYLETVEY